MAQHDPTVGTLTDGWAPDIHDPYIRRVEQGQLRPRYALPWIAPFFELVVPALSPNARILDVGAGRRPLIPKASREHGWMYVGLDIDQDELEAAGEDAYDRAIAGSISEFMPDLENSFDLVMSWQVLEHVSDIRAVIDNTYRYLRPGGRLVSLLSGRYAAFSVLARLIPYSVSKRLMVTLLGAEPEEKFPTRYEGCDASSLRQMLSSWSDFQILPQYRGANYFGFWRPLEQLYLAYEDWSTSRPNLATHYRIWAVK